MAADLPLALDLLAACLTGVPPCRGRPRGGRRRPGPCGERLLRAAAALDVGRAPSEAWAVLACRGTSWPAAAARALARAGEGGAPVAARRRPARGAGPRGRPRAGPGGGRAGGRAGRRPAGAVLPAGLRPARRRAGGGRARGAPARRPVAPDGAAPGACRAASSPSAPARGGLPGWVSRRRPVCRDLPVEADLRPQLPGWIRAQEAGASGPAHGSGSASAASPGGSRAGGRCVGTCRWKRTCARGSGGISRRRPCVGTCPGSACVRSLPGRSRAGAGASGPARGSAPAAALHTCPAASTERVRQGLDPPGRQRQPGRTTVRQPAPASPPTLTRRSTVPAVRPS